MRHRIACAAALLFCLATASSALAKSFAFPHVFESKGSILHSGGSSSWWNTQHGISEGTTADSPPQGTRESAKWSGTLLLQGSGNLKVVLHDISFVSIDTSTPGTYRYSLRTTIDADLDGQAFVVNSHTGPFDLSVFGFEPQPLSAVSFAPPVPITFTFPDAITFSPVGGGPDSASIDAGMTFTLAIPEPASASALAILAAGLIRRRK